MQNNIQVFESQEFGTMEVLMLDGIPYFPAVECARVLAYKRPHDAISRHCKRDMENRRGYAPRNQSLCRIP